ncbi:hypothetical protein GGD50_005846 [Rhizobium paranaense]|uniref:Uncharacterized protein n=1 Tax=Rhizobium paranaense TaxID=1650438 RepID=A0A7W8XX44_9HYPH|nr:hypothetical protein [Rhizobium paranaense]MBB5577195.1 hypothetical protein [Rhizobium paranaense]
MCDIISSLEVYVIQLDALPAPSSGRAAKSGGRRHLVCSVMGIFSYVEPSFVSFGSLRLLRPGFDQQRSHAAPAQFQCSGDTDRSRARDAHVKPLLKHLWTGKHLNPRFRDNVLSAASRSYPCIPSWALRIGLRAIARKFKVEAQT